MNHVSVICLDLDDTLWDLAPVIQRAEQVLYGWFEEHCPRICNDFGLDGIRAARVTVAREHPELRHDLSALRRASLVHMLERAGYGIEVADEAYRVFQTARNEIRPFADVVPALQRLRSRRRIVALTNGNADLSAIGLAHFFEAVFTAASIGVAKPDPVVFGTVSRECGLDPNAILHVGDHPEHDIVAAAAVGMPTAWVNRAGSEWPLSGHAPDHELRDLSDLASLFDT